MNRAMRRCFATALLLISVPMMAQHNVLVYGTFHDSTCTSLTSRNLVGVDWPSCRVAVWSAQETDLKINTVQQGAQTALTSADQRLTAQIQQLQDNIRRLSDANDALTKRITDLENRLQNPPQPPRPAARK